MMKKKTENHPRMDAIKRCVDCTSMMKHYKTFVKTFPSNISYVVFFLKVVPYDFPLCLFFFCLIRESFKQNKIFDAL
jgi:hypothetical protein